MEGFKRQVGIDVSVMKYILATGMSIRYQNANIVQHKLKDINMLNYDMFKFVYCATKQNLNLDNEDISSDYTFFKTMFYLKDNSLLNVLRESIIFFVKEATHENIIIDKVNGKECIIVYKSLENVPEFYLVLNEDNFNEFSSIIRMICCCEKFKIEIEEKKKNIRFKDKERQKIWEKIKANQKHNKEKAKEKAKENILCIGDIIVKICSHPKSKYNYLNITELTYYQLVQELNSIFIFDSIEFTKQQYCSYKFEFKKDPDIEWNNKLKVKIPHDVLNILQK